jgi:hypothetical protein
VLAVTQTVTALKLEVALEEATIIMVPLCQIVVGTNIDLRDLVETTSTSLLRQVA